MMRDPFFASRLIDAMLKVTYTAGLYLGVLIVAGVTYILVHGV
jgi:hypothetical protein